MDKDHHVTHLKPGIGRGGEEEAGEAPDGVREGGKIYLTHAGLEEEHHVTHREPGIGQGESCDPTWSQRLDKEPHVALPEPGIG